MTNLKIEFTDKPKPDDLDFLADKINEENPGFPPATPFAFFIKDEAGNIIAGASGFVLFGSIYTDMLWVDTAHRNKGYASSLMDKIHQYGREQGCIMATLSTMSFQNALGFYQKLGYKIDFEREGHIHHSKGIYLRKKL